MTTTMTDLQTGRTHVFNEALPGRDAYEEALALGFVGSRAAWLAHLRGFAFDPASADWEVDRAYAANAAVRHDHKVWVAVVADTGTEPGTDPAVWRMLLDGAPAQDLTDAVAAALAHKGAAQTAAADAETKRAAAATILTQTQEAAQALSPIEALHPTAIAIPAGWWDTGDRLLSGVSERAIIANWQHASLFNAGQSGGVWLGTLASALFADTAATTPAALGGNVAAVADGAPDALTMTQSNSGLQPKMGRMPAARLRNLCPISEPVYAELVQKTNTSDGAGFGDFEASLLFPANALSAYAYVSGVLPSGVVGTMSVFVEMQDAEPPSFTSTSATNVGNTFALRVNSANQTPTDYDVQDLGGGVFRVSTAVTGTGTGNCGIIQYSSNEQRPFLVTGFQLEAGPLSAYQHATSAFDVTEAGVRSVNYVQFDPNDDTLTRAIPGGADTVWAVGPGGIYVGEAVIAEGGTLSVGGAGAVNTINGAARGILRAVSGNTGRLFGWGAREGALSDAEIAWLERFNWVNGGKGLLVPADVSPSNGGFDTDTVWTKSGWTIADGKAVAGGGAGSVGQPYATTAGHAYLVAFTVSGFTAGSVRFRFSGAGNQDGIGQIGDGTFFEVICPSVSNSNVTLIASGLGFAGQIDNFTIHRLIPREEL